MRIKSYENGGYKRKDVISSGGVMTEPLYLYGLPPEKDMEAITKQYVDSMLSSFSANKFTSGVLSISRLPGFNGDITSSNGSNVLSLKKNIVTPGIYSKITVNDKGLVVDGFALTNSDVPNIDWSKVDSDKPTTLAGYGITDAISVSGGEITGNLTLSGDPTNDNQLASKQYSDAKTLSSGELDIGDMIAKPVSTSPVGFLKCNGSSVSRTTYSDLYAVIGDTYGASLLANSGKPWRSQYQVNTTQSLAITGWASDTALPAALTHSQAIVTKNRVYLLGGRNSAGTVVATVYTAAINADGTLGAWTTGTSLPGALASSQAVVVKNRAYLLGGVDANGVTSVIYVAPINADGTLGAWTSGNSFPGPLSHSQALITNDRLYMFGGINTNTGSSTSIVYISKINADGSLSAWESGQSLPQPLNSAQAVTTNNKVYILGGYNSNTSSNVNTVYYATIGADGVLNNWVTGIALPASLSATQCIVTKNRIQIFGGQTSAGAAVISSYSAPVNADGTLGTWATAANLAAELTQSQSIITSSKLYLLGGVLGGANPGPIANVYVASMTGGLNDYSPYYDGTYAGVDTTTFVLPDLSTKELTGTYTYIKYLPKV